MTNRNKLPSSCESHCRTIEFSTNLHCHVAGVLGKCGKSQCHIFQHGFSHKHIKVHGESLKGKCAVPYFQNTDLQRASSQFPLVTSDLTLRRRGKDNAITIPMTMTFKCLTSNLFFTVKKKPQVISFTMSHCAPVVQ